MSDAPRLLVHLGYPKTGTTSLQNGLFDPHPEFLHLRSRPEVRRLVDRICHAPRGSFDRELDGLLPIFRPDDFSGRCVVLSDERLTDQNPPETKQGQPLSVRFDRLRRALDGSALSGGETDLALLVVVRRQPDILVSRITHNYYAFTRDAGFRDHREYLDRALRRPDRGYLATLYYHRVLTDLARKFGRERVRVVPFELLKSDAAGFGRCVARAAGVDADGAATYLSKARVAKKAERRREGYVRPNPLLRGAQWITRVLLPSGTRPQRYGWGRFLNNVLHRVTEWSPGVRNRYVSLSEAEESRIEEIYRSDNRRLAREWGIELDRWGWAH